MNSLKLPHISVRLAEEEMNIRGIGHLNGDYGMDNLEFKNTIRIIEERGIWALSNKVLMSFFEQCLIYLNSSYNTNMELFRESEKYYEISKSEILERFNKKDLSKF